jgi:lipoyl(octanoyl) transferase
MPSGALVKRELQRRAYEPTLQAMRDFTERRQSDTPDEVWLVEHDPVYTLGQAGKREHLLRSNAIPVVQTDRGGQVTYHGPGQVVAYVLIDLRRRGYFIKEAVHRIEQAVIDLLAQHQLTAGRKPGAPGVYVLTAQGQPGAKIAALGLKVRHGCTYHGVALNVAMDLTPFQDINPCGYTGLATTDMASCGIDLSLTQAANALARHLEAQLLS